MTRYSLVLGALQATLALGLLAGGPGGSLHSYDGRRDRLRETRPAPRPECPHARGDIDDLERIEYVSSSASA